MRDGFSDHEKLLAGAEAEEAVHRLAADCFVVDADSSQSLAVEQVRRGTNLVIQGPPGTGKSQTITNIIADAVRRGKRVLFVAEKLAALEVVKRRLDASGLDAICLELHSNKANKKLLLDELKRTLSLGPPISAVQPGGDPRLRKTKVQCSLRANGVDARVGGPIRVYEHWLPGRTEFERPSRYGPVVPQRR